MPVNGVALGAVSVGALLLYSGITGKGVLATTQALVQGKDPATVPASQPVTGAVGEAAAIVAENAANAAGGAVGQAAAGAVGTATGMAIAGAALPYKGAGYVFAGAPAKGRGNWDCSSFVNWVIGHDLGLAIPGYRAGSYSGDAHGPPAIVWYAWTGATTVGHDGDLALPGDLCCWQTHIGIAIGGGQMISARSADDNPPTGINTINKSIRGEVLAIRRLKGA